MMSEFRRKLMMAAAMAQPPKPVGYIKFEDPEVERICIDKFSNDGVGVTYEDAERVTNRDLRDKFSDNDKIFKFKEFKFFKGITSIAHYWTGQNNKGVFQRCSNLTSISIPNSVITFGLNSFANCSNLADFNLNMTNITEIFDAAFKGCIKLNLVVDMPNLKVLGTNSFNNSGIIKIENLGAITKLDKVYTGQYFEGVFSNCQSLTFARLPKTLTLMELAFINCTSLETVISYAEVPPTMDGRDAFKGCAKLSNIYVPDSSVEAYKTAPEWSTYADKIKPLSTYVEQ